MGHNADLNKYNIRTDLAIELVKEGIETKKIGNIKVTNVTLNEEKAKSVSKKQGTYITIEFPDITDYENSQKIKTVFTK